jgi:serine O-acetyltransferase
LLIKCKLDYLEYLEADRKALGRTKVRPYLFILDPVWTFERQLRRVEYYTNCKNSFFSKIFMYFLRYRLKQMSLKLGFSIPINVIGPGLGIAHYGTIIIHPNTKIGRNFSTNADVIIGEKNGWENVPTIGNNVSVAGGAKIFGKIEIADNIYIGANAVVNKSFTEPGIAIAGIPARKIKDNPYLSKTFVQ